MDLQSIPTPYRYTNAGTMLWRTTEESNLEPTALEAVALPVELVERVLHEVLCHCPKGSQYGDTKEEPRLVVIGDTLIVICNQAPRIETLREYLKMSIAGSFGMDMLKRG